jgi:hypothetical protein
MEDAVREGTPQLVITRIQKGRNVGSYQKICDGVQTGSYGKLQCRFTDGDFPVDFRTVV